MDNNIPESSIRARLKALLPTPVRRVLRGLLHYCQRLSRWIVILYQMRGCTVRDQSTLIRSALYAPVISFRSLMRWQDPYLLHDCDVVVRGTGQFRLRNRSDDLWHVLPWREQAIANLLRCTLKQGDVFIDAGANIGIYTVMASRLVGPTGRVVSVEMMPDTADRLDAHVKLNGLGNVTVVRNALSAVAGQTVMATVQEGKYGQATIATNSASFGLGKQVPVRTTILDDVTPVSDRVRLMKIDLEGAELEALHGAKSLLSRLDALVYESWGTKREGSDPVDRYLEGKGFRLKQIDGNNCLAECTEAQ